MSNWKRISNVINEEIDSKALGGAAVYAVQNGKVMMNEGFGRDKSNSIYRIYSMTKIITSVVIFKLIENGKIELNAPISKYIPEFANHRIFDENGNICPSKEITIQNLLNMEAGMPYPSEESTSSQEIKKVEQEVLLEMSEGKSLTTLDVVKRFAKVPGDFVPGTSWEYGISADILGGIVEAVTNKRFSKVIKDIVTEPLKMYDTAFCVPQNKFDRISTITTRDNIYQYVAVHERRAINSPENKVLTLPLIYDVETVEPYFLAGGGGLYTTAQDYSKVLQMLLNNGQLNGVRILKPETVKFMTTPQLNGELYKKMHKDGVGKGVPGYSYSNLLRILVKPSEARVLGVNGNIGEYGWDAAGGAFCLVDPQTNTTFVYMQQDLHCAEPILRRKIYQALMEK